MKTDIAKYVSIGRGGVSAHITHSHRVEGYIGHSWEKYVGPDTVVIDTRAIPDSRIVTWAISGPMCNPDLPPSSVERILGAIEPWTAGANGAGFGNAGGFDSVSLDVYRTLAESCGATVSVGALPADVVSRPFAETASR